MYFDNKQNEVQILQCLFVTLTISFVLETKLFVAVSNI